MSKLAHSNDETMTEIELRQHGITPILAPICEAATPARWYRPDGGRCPYIAHYETKDGMKVCLIHAKLMVP